MSESRRGGKQMRGSEMEKEGKKGEEEEGKSERERRTMVRIEK